MKLGDIKEGDTLIADDGFTCLKEGERLPVYSNGHSLFVYCRGGEERLEAEREHQHYLGGQVSFDDGETIVGFRRVE